MRIFVLRAQQPNDEYIYVWFHAEALRHRIFILGIR